MIARSPVRILCETSVAGRFTFSSSLLRIDLVDALDFGQPVLVDGGPDADAGTNFSRVRRSTSA